MNEPNNIIESGLLELYALGSLSQSEMTLVEKEISTNPLAKKELENIELTLEKLAQKHGKTPPSNLKNTILQAVSNTTESTHKNTQKEAKVIALNPKSTSYRYAAAAGFALFITSMAVNFILYSSFKNEQVRADTLAQNQVTLADNVETYKAKLNETTNQLGLIAGNTKKIMLASTTGKPDFGTVFWDTKTGELSLYKAKMPAAPSGKQYQLWAIIDGVPVSAGMINNEGDMMQAIDSKFTNAQAFALSLEKEGGVESPTTEAIMFVGATA